MLGAEVSDDGRLAVALLHQAQPIACVVALLRLHKQGGAFSLLDILLAGSLPLFLVLG